MPPLSGKSTRVLFDQFDLTAFFTKVAAGANVDMLDTTTFGKNARTFIPGLRAATVNAEGLWDSTLVLGSDVVLSAALSQAGERAVTVAPGANGIGSRAQLLACNENKYSIEAPVDGVTSIVAELTAQTGMEGGVLLADQTYTTSQAGIGLASVDNGAGSTNGAVAHFHAPVATGAAGSLIVKVQHSTDNSAWADLITFTAVAFGTPASQRVEVAGTVNRYTRALVTLTGSGLSIQFTVAIARR